jgi:hypothetical protein
MEVKRDMGQMNHWKTSHPTQLVDENICAADQAWVENK